MLHQIAQLFTNDPTLTLFVLGVPAAILIDVLTGAASAIKQRTFTFRMLADFARHDLHAFVVIVLATLALIASGASANAAVIGEKTALVVLFLSILTSIGAHVQELTGISPAIWETALQGWFLRQENLPVDALPMDVAEQDTTPRPVVTVPETTPVPESPTPTS